VTSERGHEVIGHTADVILEAWGPDLASCAAEAVAALVATCADTSRARVVDRRPVRLDPAPPTDLLHALLEEVVFTLDTEASVPVAAEVTATADGALEAVLLLADPGTVEPVGSAPKAISRSELAVDETRHGVRARFLVDV